MANLDDKSGKPAPPENAVFLKAAVLAKFPDGGNALKSAISTEFQRNYPEGGLLFWRVDPYGAELVFE